MRSHLQHGMSAAEAARLTLTEADGGTRDDDEPVLRRRAQELRQALDDFDESSAQSALDSVLAEFSTETVLTDLVLPYLHELGERWASGEASVGQEHFASQLIRGRLLGLARGWDRGAGPRALLACAPGEQHDLGLIAFGRRPARPRLAHHVSRPGHATRNACRECPLARAARDRDRIRFARSALEVGGRVATPGEHCTRVARRARRQRSSRQEDAGNIPRRRPGGRSGPRSRHKTMRPA